MRQDMVTGHKLLYGGHRRMWTVLYASLGGGEVVEPQGITHKLHAELPDGVVHQHSEVLHRHTHAAVRPTALLWPVLVTLILETQGPG